jgi:hypothetical protein
MVMAGDITQGTVIRPPAYHIMRSMGPVLTGSLIGMRNLLMGLPHITHTRQNPRQAAGMVGGRPFHHPGGPQLFSRTAVRLGASLSLTRDHHVI